MTRVLLKILVGVVAVCILTGAHIYLWRRLVRDTRMPRVVHRLTFAAFAVMVAAVPLTLHLTRKLPLAWLQPLALVVYTWLGLVFFFGLALAPWEALRLRAWIRRRRALSLAPPPAPAPPAPAADAAPPDPSRRVALARIAAGGALLIGAGGTAFGRAGAYEALATPEIPIRLVGWPRALDGLRLVLLADLHVGPIIGQDYVARVVDVAMRQRPDLIAMVGDLVDGPVDHLLPLLAPLTRLRAPHGLWFATGNHEFFSGIRAWMKALPTLGFRVLANERVVIGCDDAGAGGFELAGVHDLNAERHFEGYDADVAPVVAGRSAARPLILLAHQPRHVHQAAAAGVDLQLSGHTHGGQIWPFGALTKFRQPYFSGLHRHGEHTQIFVTRGAGFWGPPVRVLAPPEVATLVIRGA
jgi:uncharacterized protein